MDLILWRHAEAEPGEPDLARELTPRGVKQARRVAKWLEPRLPDACRILVSPAARAQQTALALERKFKTKNELAPDVVHPVEKRTIGELWQSFDRDGHRMTAVDIEIPPSS